jgi:septin family protein
LLVVVPLSTRRRAPPPEHPTQPSVDMISSASKAKAPMQEPPTITPAVKHEVENPADLLLSRERERHLEAQHDARMRAAEERFTQLQQQMGMRFEQQAQALLDENARLRELVLLQNDHGLKRTRSKSRPSPHTSR